MQIFRQQLDGTRIGNRNASHHADVIAHRPLESMGKRQKRQHGVRSGNGAGHQGRMGVKQNIAVRQHHALGATRGTRGVHDRGQRITPAHLFVKNCMFGQPLLYTLQPYFIMSGYPVQTDHALYAWKLCAHTAQCLPLFCILEQQHLHARIVDDIGHTILPILSV